MLTMWGESSLVECHFHKKSILICTLEWYNSNKNESFISSATNGREMHRVINTHVEAIKIGRQIAEHALDSNRKIDDSGEFELI